MLILKTDKVYEMERNKLIPFAAKFTNEKYGKFYQSVPTIETREEWACTWTRCFLWKMNSLARRQGLI